MQGYRVARRSLIALGALGELLLGCSEMGPQLVPETDPDRTNLPTHTHRAVVSSEGAVISSGDAKVVIPRGALTEPVEIVVEATDEGFGPIPNAEEERVLAFLPHGTQFLKPVTIQVPHEHGSSDALTLLTSEPGQPWAKVEGATFTGAYAEADVMHFSFFFASPTPASEIVGVGGSGGAGGAGDDLGLGGASGMANTAGASGDGGAAGGSGGGGLDYLDDGEWRGHLFALSDPSSSVERDGRCITGEVGDPIDGPAFALWGWNIHQELESTVTGSWEPTTEGVFYSLLGDGELRLQLVGESGQTWCYLASGRGFAAFESFNTQCWSGLGLGYDQSPLKGVSVVVPGSGLSPRPFHMCVEELRAANQEEGGGGGAPGEGGLSYLEQGVWHGQLYAGTEGTSQVVRDGMCIAGEVATHELGASFALWGWNINQEEGSDVVSAWTPDTDALAYDLSSDGAPLRLNVYDEQGQTYCHLLSDESGVVTLTDFNTQCWNGQGDAYDGATPLAGVQVLVPGNTNVPQPFAVCVNEIAPLP